MVKNILITSILLLTGCNTVGSLPDTQIVEVPVFRCPEPVKIDRPKLLIRELEKADTKNPDKVFKSYVGTVKQLEQYSNLLELQLNLYKDLTE